MLFELTAGREAPGTVAGITASPLNEPPRRTRAVGDRAGVEARGTVTGACSLADRCKKTKRNGAL